MIDDALRNLLTAHDLGLFTIQVGTDLKSDPVDAAILCLEKLPEVFPARPNQVEYV